MKERAQAHRKPPQANADLAVCIWGQISSVALNRLEELTREHRLSVAAGDLALIGGRWHVTHAGLLRIAQLRGCSAIETSIDLHLSNPTANRWVFKATVYRRPTRRGFSAYGDADPSNVSPMVRGAELRVAETRAVNRALRKAYGIGLCSVEELGWVPEPPKPASSSAHSPNGSSHGERRLRDQLSLLVREYQLDPTLVKAYAADFCGTQTLKDASRALVESFITHLSCSAKEDRAGLICKLNSYSCPAEVTQ